MNNTTQLSIKQYIQQPNVQKRVEELLKDRAPQFMLTLSSMVNNDLKLQECEPASLFTAALTITALDLPMQNNLGFAWIIPYKDRKSGKTLAQAQLGYKAFVQLAMRSNQFKTLNAVEVRKGEYLGMDRLSGEIAFKWEEDNDKRNKLPVVGYVAFMKLLNGFEKSFYMTAQEAKAHGQKYSQNFKKYNSGMWADEFDAMAKKTVIKLMLSRFAPMSVKSMGLARALEADQAVVEEDKMTYIDNQKESAQEISEEKERQRLIKYIKNCRTLKSLELCKTSCTTDELVELYNEKESKLKNAKTTIQQPSSDGASGREADGPITSEEVESLNITEEEDQNGQN